MKLRLSLLLYVTFLISSCTTNYYLVTSNANVDLYQTAANKDLLISIPAGNVFLTKGKSKVRYTQYGSIKGYSRLSNLRRQVKFKQSEYANLVFHEQTGYGYKGYVTSTPNAAEGNYRKASAPKSSSGGPVHVRGYTRKNGTYVQPHTRSAPRRH
jgi:hypothetical protein